jgi:anti-anti-sigma factor
MRDNGPQPEQGRRFMEEFSVTVFGSPASGTRVTLAGELDLAAADEFWTTLEPLLQPRSSLVVDCAELSFLDSAGIRVLLQAAQRAGELGGEWRLTAVQPVVLRVLELAGVTDLLRTS